MYPVMHRAVRRPAYRVLQQPLTSGTFEGTPINIECFTQVLKPQILFPEPTVAMFFKLLPVAALCATAVHGARVQFWTTRDGCAGPASEDYQNVPCNSCVDPPLGE